MNKYAIECVMITINKTVLGFSCCNYVPCALLLVCLLCSPVNMLVVVVQLRAHFDERSKKKHTKLFNAHTRAAEKICVYGAET